jgi:outer membrane protein assembly factor BamE
MHERRLSYSYFAALQTAYRPRFLSSAASAMAQRAPGRHVCGIVLAALLVSACGPLSPYRADVQQGNVVTQDMIAKLQPGMTRSQVRFALGTPLIVDPFRQDRWDYVYMLTKQGEVKERRRVVVVFKDDKLVGFEGDVVPQGMGKPIERGPAVDKPTTVPADLLDKKM